MASGLRSAIGNVGRSGRSTIEYLGGMWYLFQDSVYWATVGVAKGHKFGRRAAFEQMVRAGVKSIPITFLVLFFVGMILAFQMSRVLMTLGFIDQTADIVGIAIVWELGPLLTAIVMAGFVGASIAAEIGTMVVSEEIVALETSAIDPVRFLVLPRLFALMVMLPCLTVLTNLVGLLGGFIIGTGLLDIAAPLYIRRTCEALKVKYLAQGLIKIEAFAIAIVLIACYEGLNVRGGAEGVGKATTESVVRAIVFTIVADLLFTTVFFYIW